MSLECLVLLEVHKHWALFELIKSGLSVKVDGFHELVFATHYEIDMISLLIFLKNGRMLTVCPFHHSQEYYN